MSANMPIEDIRNIYTATHVIICVTARDDENCIVTGIPVATATSHNEALRVVERLSANDPESDYDKIYATNKPKPEHDKRRTTSELIARIRDGS